MALGIPSPNHDKYTKRNNKPSGSGKYSSLSGGPGSTGQFRLNNIGWLY
jgi:hypothetical protein